MKTLGFLIVTTLSTKMWSEPEATLWQQYQQFQHYVENNMLTEARSLIYKKDSGAQNTLRMGILFSFSKGYQIEQNTVTENCQVDTCVLAFNAKRSDRMHSVQVEFEEQNGQRRIKSLISHRLD